MAISNASSGFRPGVCTSTTRPTAPFNGQVIYETDTKQTLVWQGSTWVMLTDADEPPGLQLIKTQTVGTGVSSVFVSDVFSSQYQNYRIIYMGGVSNVDAGMSLYLGSSVGTGYYASQMVIFYSNGSTSTIFVNNQNSWQNVATNLTSIAAMDVDLQRPFEVATTGLTINSRHDFRTGGGASVGGGFHNVAASYTGFTLAPGASGTLTGGTIRVYGYRN